MEDFRRYLRVVRKEFAPDIERHVSEDELIEFQQGRLESAARDKVRSHLERCSHCVEIFKGAIAFFESPEERSGRLDAMTMGMKEEAWWQRAQAGSEPVPLKPDLRPTGFWHNPRATFALAASLLLAIGGVSLWALRVRRENQQLLGQSRGWEERWKALERDNRRLEEETRASQQRSSAELAELQQPGLNTPIYDLLPRGSVPRSGAESDLNRIRVPVESKNVVVILHRDDDRPYPAYEIEILDRNDRIRWQGGGLKPTSDGNFVMTIDRKLLNPGKYKLRLYGRRGSASRMIAEYVVLVE